MAITDTIVFGAYQANLGTTYARGYQEAYNMGATYEQYVLARQAWIAGMSSSEVSTGLAVVNAHLSAESTYTAAVVTNLTALPQLEISLGEIHSKRLGIKQTHKN